MTENMTDFHPKIFVDSRELRSPVVKDLEKLGIDIEIHILEVSDYILSDRVACERKTPEDFFNSLFGEKKLFGQLYDLSHSYERPLLLFEGYETELFTTRNVNPKAVQGILNSIALMRIPILYTLNAAGTAEIMVSIAMKEQMGDKRGISRHGKRSHLTENEKLEYIISAIPGIGTQTARDLLKAFGTIEKIATAGIGDLQEIPGIGEKTACLIRDTVTGVYK